MNLSEIKQKAEKEIKDIKNSKELKLFSDKYLGKKGEIRKLFLFLKDLPIEEKKRAGQEINDLIKTLEEEIALIQRKLKDEKQERIDDSLHLGREIEIGHLHPLTIIRRELEYIFEKMGFSVVEGPELETEWYNFDALNIPEDHPARDALSLGKTLYLKSGGVLRTQTSSGQIRHMEKMEPPIRIVIPGRIYRYEATDASHEINFYQLEGLLVDKVVSVANLKAVLEKFLEEFFNRKVEIRLRPSYFPFTEPSFEVDMLCTVCKGRGCSTCKNNGWVEILGAGMVHPNVIKNGGFDPKKWKGFAFGLGVDRLAMMKYQINDVRLFYSGNLKFINQF